MQPGDVVAERFAIEALAGSGGMARVYRATDLVAKGEVALKVLGARRASEMDRFAREARLIAELHHPGLVRYVAHGRTPAGEEFIAMEWLSGETLAARIQRVGLDARESVALVTAVADALAVAHGRGVVHRDLKPTNLMLVDDAVERVKILDFGVARLEEPSLEATRAGAIVGTPGYMAPEQARGDPDVGPAADVFSLGCVLFECLTGRPPFVGARMMAVLAKILLEDAPRVSAVRDGIPEELDQLVARMLAKDPAQRPKDARALQVELSRIVVGKTERAKASAPQTALTTGEQRLMCVILAGDVDEAVQVTALRAAVAPFGARLDPLASGALVCSIAREGVASDQAVQAALCALAMRGVLETIPMALATGRGRVSEHGSVGEVIDRAARLLAVAERGAHLDSPVRSIRIDDVTAGLLSARFDVSGDADGLELRGVRDVIEPARTLLGKQTSCVGRARELSTLAALFDECASEPIARAVLVTGPAGGGKSRLRYEFLKGLSERGAAHEVWIGRGDPMKVGSPFGILAPAVRRAMGLLDGELEEARAQKVRARIARHLRGEGAVRVTTFLGELCGVRTTDDENAQLRAARRDPVLMGDQMRQAWEDWLAAECSARPVVLVLEDLQWGDLPTVKFVDSALRNLKGSPFMVLALARPDVDERFPKLWSERGVEVMRLRELTRSASASLVRQVLGDADQTIVEQLVSQAEGNAFYLEELVRTVAETGARALPETVLAMVQARVDRIEPEGRRVLRAASVFGQAFWRGGVSALIGGVHQTGEVSDWLDELCAREVIGRRAQSRFPGEEEFVFRHALVREAAYAMLTDDDARLGHRLAAEWLERKGERDAAVLAEHFERGGQGARAIAWYRAAAEDALEGDDLAVVLSRVERGIACGAEGGELGALLRLRAEVLAWRGERKAAYECARDAMKLLPPFGQPWFAAAALSMSNASRAGDFPAVKAIAAALPALDPEGESLPVQVITQARAVSELLQIGDLELAERLSAPLDRLRERSFELDPEVMAWIENALAWRALFAGDTGESLKLDEASARDFELAGDVRNACRQWCGAGYERMLLGRYVEAETALRDGLSTATRMGMESVVLNAKHNLGLVLSRLHRHDEAVRLEREALEGYRRLGDRKLTGASLHYLAIIYLEQGDLVAAEREARACIESLASFPPLLPRGLATLAAVLLRCGRAEEAASRGNEAMALLTAQGTIEDGEAMIRVNHAEALWGTGDRDRARVCVRAARERLERIAAKISDSALCRSFLEEVPENRRTLELARAWGAETR